MTISVIIPLFNGARFLTQAIASVRAQSVPVHQLIVVDDGSSDNGPEVARSFPGVRVESRPHGGQGAALNHGVAISSGTLLAFLDQDDLWVEQKLEWQLRALARGVEAVAGQAEQFSEGSETETRTFPARLVSALLIRREAWHRIGPFRPELGMGMQLEWFARAAARGLSLTLLDRVVYRRRLHDSNYGRRSPQNRRDYARAVKAVLDERRRSAT